MASATAGTGKEPNEAQLAWLSAQWAEGALVARRLLGGAGLTDAAAELGVAAPPSVELKAFLSQLDVAAARLRQARFPPLSKLVAEVAELLALAGALPGAEAQLGLRLALALPLLDERPGLRALPEQQNAAAALLKTMSGRRFFVAEKLREAISCFKCGGVMPRWRVGSSTDDYRCTSCAAEMAAEWHELGAVYAEHSAERLGWVLVEPRPEPAPSRVASRNNVTLISKLGAAERWSGKALEKLGAVVKVGAAAAASDGEWLAVVSEDGALALAPLVPPLKTVELRDAELKFVAAGFTSLDGATMCVALGAGGQLLLVEPCNGSIREQLAPEALIGTASVASSSGALAAQSMCVAGEFAFVGTVDGRLRRRGLRPPFAESSFLATPDRSGFDALIVTSSGALCALTTAGRLLVYSASEPQRPPTTPVSFPVISCIEWDTSQLLLRSSGDQLWLLDVARGIVSAVTLKLDGDAAAIARAGELMLHAQPSGSLALYAIEQQGTELRLKRTGKLPLQGSVAFLV